MGQSTHFFCDLRRNREGAFAAGRPGCNIFVTTNTVARNPALEASALVGTLAGMGLLLVAFLVPGVEILAVPACAPFRPAMLLGTR